MKATLIASSSKFRLLETEDGLLLQELAPPLVDGDPVTWQRSHYMDNTSDLCFGLLRGYSNDPWLSDSVAYMTTNPPSQVCQVDRIEVGPYVIAFSAQFGSHRTHWHHRAMAVGKRIEHRLLGPMLVEVTDETTLCDAMLHWLRSRIT